MLDPGAVRLAKKLDGLPLALATAGAYVDQAAISFSDYLRLYKESWARLQTTSPKLSSYEDRTFYSTWQVSFDHVEQRNGLSARLLRLWAYFDNQDLWFELLRHSDSKDPDWIRELVKDELSFYSAVRVLSDHGLVELVEVGTPSQELTESRGYSIHGCVHSWTIHVLNQEWDYELARVAMKFVGLHVPGEEAVRPWLKQRRLLQHAARCSYIVLNGLVAVDDMAWTCHRLGRLYQDQGKLAQAEEMYQQALQGYKKSLGPEHTSTLNTVNNLGNLYNDQGKLGQAEEMYQQALQGYEKALGLEHTSTLNTVNNLGNLYKNQGKLGQAEEMYQRALQGYKKALGGANNTTTYILALRTVNNLGLVYADQGKLGQAEEMYQRALQGYKKALGADNATTYIPALSTLNNLGILYKNQGKLDQAKEMYQQALQGYEMALGLERTPTLDTVNNLGNLYTTQGRLGQAEKMYQRALQGKEKALGPEHMSTLDTVNNLGSLYTTQGKLDEAKEMYQRALQGYEKAHGTDNTTTYIPALNTIWGLGSLFERQADLGKARMMYSKALVGYEKVVGPDHPKSRSLRDKLRALDTVRRSKL
jgi:tetratricopeptide (TPR) repeat protein